MFLMGLPHPNWVALGVAVVAGAGLVWWELRADHPFFDVRLLATNLALTRTYLRFALATLCVYTVLYGLTQWLGWPGYLGRGGRAAAVAHERSVRCPHLAPVEAQPGPHAAARRGGVLPGGIRRGARAHHQHPDHLDRGRHPGLRDHARHEHQRQPDDALHPGHRQPVGTASGLFRTFGYIGSIASSAIISIVFHTSVTDHGMHVIALIMVAVSALGLVIVVADRGSCRRPGRDSARAHPARRRPGTACRERLPGAGLRVPQPRP